MNKIKTLLCIVFILLSINIFAQVGISSTTVITPNAGAELDVISANNNTGVLIPSLTEAQITAYATNGTVALRPYHGMLIFNVDTKLFMYNAGDQTTVLWSYVGSIPVVTHHTSLTAIEGDIRYCANDNLIYFYNGTVWKFLMP